MEKMEVNGAQRWMAKRRLALVLQILKGETSLAEAARAQGLTVGEIEDWRDKFIRSRFRTALKGRPRPQGRTMGLRTALRS